MLDLKYERLKLAKALVKLGFELQDLAIHRAEHDFHNIITAGYITPDGDQMYFAVRYEEYDMKDALIQITAQQKIDKGE